MNARQIEKSIEGKVKKSKIQQIINYFFYVKEFDTWLNNQSGQELQQLNGQFRNRWEYILNFDKSLDDEKLNYAWIPDCLKVTAVNYLK